MKDRIKLLEQLHTMIRDNRMYKDNPLYSEEEVELIKEEIKEILRILPSYP